MPHHHKIFLLLVVVVLSALLSPSHTIIINDVSGLCTQLYLSPDANNTVLLGNSLSISLDPITCVTDKSVTFQGTSITATQVSSGSLSLKTSGYVRIQDITFSSSTVSIENAAQLTLTNVQFSSVSPLFYSALTVRNVSHAVLSECTLALNKVPVPISFDSCGTVVVRDSTFSRNDASTVGAISATNVASLTLADSSFVYNSGSLAHVLNASNTNVGLSGCTFVSNGGLLSTDHDLIAITGGSLSMAGSQVRLNWGATIALRNLTAASNVTGSTFELNFNARQRSLIDVDGCTDVFTLSRSTISYNLGGGLAVRKCEADVSHTKLWAQGSFGMLCGSLATINASTASIYKNGWTIDSLFGPAKFIDTTCASGCNGFNLFGGLDACVNATTIVQGYTVNCPTGLNKCSQCNEAATCADCNGLPFGSAQSTCANWNTLKSSGAKVTYNGTSPTCSLTTISDDGNTFTGASMVLNYEAVVVYYLNTSSNAEVALYRFPINDSDYTRTRGNTANDQYCINYERVLDSGAGLLLQQCLFDGEQSVLFGNHTLTVPQDYTKIAVSLSNMVTLDNQTSSLYPDDIDISTRRVAVEMSLRMSEEGAMGNVPSGVSYVEVLLFEGDNFDMAMELPNYAVFNNDNASTFAYNASSVESAKAAQYKLVLEFKGTFDTVYYDPQFGLLLGSTGGGGDNSILVEVLVPVLVGAALLAVVVFAIGFVAWVVWKKRENNLTHQHQSMVNFSVEGGEDRT